MLAYRKAADVLLCVVGINSKLSCAPKSWQLADASRFPIFLQARPQRAAVIYCRVLLFLLSLLVLPLPVNVVLVDIIPFDRSIYGFGP